MPLDPDVLARLRKRARQGVPQTTYASTPALGVWGRAARGGTLPAPDPDPGPGPGPGTAMQWMDGTDMYFVDGSLFEPVEAP